MNDTAGHTSKLLLHACCGPCSLEPVRVLRGRGENPDIYYANSNIEPADEYARRLEAIRDWARTEGISFTEGPYDPTRWNEEVAKPWSKSCSSREERCRACYRIRFEESAAFAKENGYEALGTTLSVSPYQYTDLIRAELERACAIFGIKAEFEDWRPYYDEATRRSREAGMYRQNYCGCSFSKAEAEKDREQRKTAKAEERMRYRKEHAAEIAERQAEMEKHRAERRAYDEKKARQRAILKAMRAEKVEAINEDL